MEYRTFPATGDRLSVLGFGAMGFAGWFGTIDDGDGIRALHTDGPRCQTSSTPPRAYGTLQCHAAHSEVQRTHRYGATNVEAVCGTSSRRATHRRMSRRLMMPTSRPSWTIGTDRIPSASIVATTSDRSSMGRIVLGSGVMTSPAVVPGVVSVCSGSGKG
jgi:hypothetical protein